MNELPADLSVFTTADGSPTLAFTRADGYVEKMHHSGGALTESLYIYHHVLEMALERGWPVRVLSFGLGLGYNELITIASLEAKGVQDYSVESFEAYPYLREEFAAWLEGRDGGGLASLYEAITRALEERFAIENLRAAAGRALEDDRLRLLGPFPEAAAGTRDRTVVYFDAFSKKMNDAPWVEDALERQLGPCLASSCVLSTYAATGSLNRGLRRLGFRLLPRPGFQGKRESTLALRE